MSLLDGAGSTVVGGHRKNCARMVGAYRLTNKFISGTVRASTAGIARARHSSAVAHNGAIYVVDNDYDRTANQPCRAAE